MNVLITGGSGYIAKHIIKGLLEEGYDVRTSVRNSNRIAEIEALFPEADIEFVTLNLLADEGWEAAMEGVDVLIHTASPFPAKVYRDAERTIRPAFEGTQRALQAAQKAGVRRVILTSSVAAIRNTKLKNGDLEYDEGYWSDLDHSPCTPYEYSKTLSEKWAWDFVAEHPEMDLTTICPGFVIGAPLDKRFGTSVSFLKRVYDAKDPFVADIRFPMADVRDVARAHVGAIENISAYGERLAVTSGIEDMVKIAQKLDSICPERKISTRIAPRFALRMFSWFDSSAKFVIYNMDNRAGVSGDKAARLLGLEYTPLDASLRDMVDYFQNYAA